MENLYLKRLFLLQVSRSGDQTIVLRRRPRFWITISSGLGAGLQESLPCRLFKKLSIALTSVEFASPKTRKLKLKEVNKR